MSKNPCNKLVKPKDAYQVWTDGKFTYFVLRKYKSPESEEKDRYARWHCLTTSPVVPQGEYGDVYCITIKRTCRLIDNPLKQKRRVHKQEGEHLFPAEN